MGFEKIAIEIIGWLGSALIVLAYLLLSLNKLSGTSYFYQVLNIIGSACLVINTIYNRAFPSAGLNVVWAIIGLIAILKSSRDRKKQRFI